MGIEVPIAPGGHFPQIEATAARLPEDLPILTEGSNHPSFSRRFGSEGASGASVLQELLDAGFAELFESRAAAAAALGGPVRPAPLANIAKERSDGTFKFRLIQDLKRNEVNSASRLSERPVFPRPVDHAADLVAYEAGRREGLALRVAIIDFADAFMSIPLDARERRYNVAEVEVPMRRTRGPVEPREPSEGTILSWRVLGFGGRPNPLIFSRVVGMLLRATQMMFDPGVADPVALRAWPALRAQLYVDDTVGTFLGSDAAIEEGFDVLLSFWLACGAPVAWKKVSIVDASAEAPHTWIGVNLAVRAPAVVAMTLPPAFVEELTAALDDFAVPSGTVTLAEAEALVGKVSRVVHVVPLSRGYASALWAALAEGKLRSKEAMR